MKTKAASKHPPIARLDWIGVSDGDQRSRSVLPAITGHIQNVCIPKTLTTPPSMLSVSDHVILNLTPPWLNSLSSHALQVHTIATTWHSHNNSLNQQPVSIARRTISGHTVTISFDNMLVLYTSGEAVVSRQELFMDGDRRGMSRNYPFMCVATGVLGSVSEDGAFLLWCSRDH